MVLTKPCNARYQENCQIWINALGKYNRVFVVVWFLSSFTSCMHGTTLSDRSSSVFDKRITPNRCVVCAVPCVLTAFTRFKFGNLSTTFFYQQSIQIFEISLYKCMWDYWLLPFRRQARKWSWPLAPSPLTTGASQRHLSTPNSTSSTSQTQMMFKNMEPSQIWYKWGHSLTGEIIYSAFVVQGEQYSLVMVSPLNNIVY